MRIAVCGYYGMGNFGDELFLSTLRQALAPHHVFPYSSRVDVGEVDAIVVGGGDLITPYHFAAGYFPPVLNQVPTWIYGVGIVDYYPEETWPQSALEQYRRSIGASRGLWVRDERSADIARRHRFHSRMEQIPDIAFAYRPVDIPLAVSKPTVGVCVFSYDGFPLKKVTAMLLKALRQGCRVQILPVIHNLANAYADLDTCRVLKQALLTEMPHADVDLPEHDYYLELTYSRIRHLDYLISFKLHPALVALRHGVPVLALSRMGKVRELMKAFMLEDWVCDYTADEAVLMAAMDRMMAQGGERIKAALPRIRQTEAAAHTALQHLRMEMEAGAAP